MRSPVIDTKEEKRRLVLNGVAGTQSDDKTVNSSNRVEKKRDDEDSYENRFKLRNGKVFEEKADLVGVERKGDTEHLFDIEESLKELAQLADTAGLMAVGSTYQKLTSPRARTYIRSGKVAEIKSAIHALGVETVIFDDELLAGQSSNLEKTFGGDVRVCDCAAPILDIFNQPAATHEAVLQVKGMGEKQIEVDKRILRTEEAHNLFIVFGNCVWSPSMTHCLLDRGYQKRTRICWKTSKAILELAFFCTHPCSVIGRVYKCWKEYTFNRLTGANVLAENQ